MAKLKDKSFKGNQYESDFYHFMDTHFTILYHCNDLNLNYKDSKLISLVKISLMWAKILSYDSDLQILTERRKFISLDSAVTP